MTGAYRDALLGGYAEHGRVTGRADRQCHPVLLDCYEVLPALVGVDAVVTDPPYGVNLSKCGDPRGGSHGLTHVGYVGGDASGQSDAA